jgi:MFS family permease
MLAAHLDTLRGWSPRRWVVAAVSALATILVIGLPTVLIPNPVFGREVPTVWWNWPALLVAAVLSGLLVATYVRQSTPLGELDNAETEETGSRRGMVGGVLTFFAVGCPVCNKIVLLALGTSGAMQWFAPVQPILAVAAVAALVWALHARLRGERSCAVRPVDLPDPALRR